MKCCLWLWDGGSLFLYKKKTFWRAFAGWLKSRAQCSRAELNRKELESNLKALKVCRKIKHIFEWLCQGWVVSPIPVFHFQVSALNKYDPPLEVIAARDHMTHLVYQLMQPQVIFDRYDFPMRFPLHFMSLSSPQRPLPWSRKPFKPLTALMSELKWIWNCVTRLFEVTQFVINYMVELTGSSIARFTKTALANMRFRMLFHKYSPQSGCSIPHAGPHWPAGLWEEGTSP